MTRIRKEQITSGSAPDNDSLVSDGAGNVLFETITSSGSGGGIEEAPINGKQYAREDAGWTEVTSSGSSGGDTIFLSMADKTGHYTGFPNNADTILSFTSGSLGITRTLTLAGTDFKIYINGIEYNIATNMTKQIPDVTGLYWFWIELVGETPTLQTQIGSPGFDKCLVATVYWNTTIDKGILSNERHWMGRDKWLHEYLHETVGARWFSGGTISFPTESTFALTQCELYDEDIESFCVAASTCKILYRNGSANWEWDDAQTYLAKINGSTLRWNDGNSLADLGVSKYMAMWVFATNNVSEPFISLMGQVESNTIALARTDNTPSNLTLTNLPSAEMKLLYRVIFKQGTTAPIETSDYRSVSNLPVSNYQATDHSVLSNLDYATSGHTGFEPLKGVDDNFVTDAEKIKLSNLSNTNTGDQVVPVGIEQVAGYALVAYDEDTGQFTRAEVATSGSGGGGGGGTDILGVQIFS